jgi:peptidoglycan L-alanyl-D-glutamate endopeptidase CwlK
MTLAQMIEAVQKELGIQVDGKAGPETWGAIYRRIVPQAPARKGPAAAAATDMAPADARSEGHIATLLPEVRPLARALVHKAAAMGIQIRIISGFRTYEAQAALYAQGRTSPGRVVTNARPGYSNHNFGIAFDVGVFEGSRYLGESPTYKAVGALGMDIGLEWGGSWKTLVDEPHFQLRPSWAAGMAERQMLAELRTRRTTEAPVYA